MARKGQKRKWFVLTSLEKVGVLKSSSLKKKPAPFLESPGPSGQSGSSQVSERDPLGDGWSETEVLANRILKPRGWMRAEEGRGKKRKLLAFV